MCVGDKFTFRVILKVPASTLSWCHFYLCGTSLSLTSLLLRAELQHRTLRLIVLPHELAVGLCYTRSKEPSAVVTERHGSFVETVITPGTSDITLGRKMVCSFSVCPALMWRAHGRIYDRYDHTRLFLGTMYACFDGQNRVHTDVFDILRIRASCLVLLLLPVLMLKHVVTTLCTL